MKTTFRKTLARIAGLAGAVLLAGCRAQQNDPVAERAALTVPIEVERAVTGTLSIGRTYSATLEGEEQANIVSKISERVAGIHAQVGQNVSADQVIITLDKTGPSSQFYQAEANFKNAEKNLERAKSLYTEGAVSLQSLDGAQMAYDVARANYIAARSIVELSTPIAGVVTAVNANIGDLAAPGTALATVARIRRMRAIFNLNETDVTALAVGQDVAIASEARPDLRIPGRIVQISRSADVRSRSFEVKANFTNTPDHWFRPGMFAKVSLKVTSRESVILIPNAAIQTDGVTSWVFVVKDGRAYQRTVQQGMTDGEQTEILKGLLPTDTVATIGVNNVRDSIRVSVAQQAESKVK